MNKMKVVNSRSWLLLKFSVFPHSFFSRVSVCIMKIVADEVSVGLIH